MLLSLSYLISLYLFLLGLFIGSFLLVVVDRLYGGKSFLTGRSQCEYCHHSLSWLDLIPVFSFLFLRGKCRYCHTKLSIYYPIVEMVTGFAFAGVYMGLSVSPLITSSFFSLFLMYHLFIVGCLLIIFFMDLRYGLIPFAVVIPTSVAALLYHLLFDLHAFLFYLVAALGTGGFFLLLHLGTKGRGMGFGDVVFATCMGLLLGFPTVVVGLYIAFLTGAGISLILISAGRKKLSGSTIPFGPFLVIGTYVCLLWKEPVTDFFLRILHLGN